MKITKADFPQYVDFTENLEERKINHYIQTAFDRDVKPKLSEVVYLLIFPEAIEDGLLPLWNAIKPYWVYAAYYRHSLIHGINHTQAGFTQAVGNNYEQISDKRRAELLAQVKKDMFFYEGEMLKYIQANYPTENNDLSCCGTTSKRKNRIGLRVVKSRERGCTDDYRTVTTTSTLTPEVITATVQNLLIKDGKLDSTLLPDEEWNPEQFEKVMIDGQLTNQIKPGYLEGIIQGE